MIAKIFGHSDKRTTIRYLGLDHDDMHLAMQQYARYQKGAIVHEEVQNQTVPVNVCGGTGICNQQTDWLDGDLYQGRYNVRYADVTISSARRYER